MNLIRGVIRNLVNDLVCTVQGHHPVKIITKIAKSGSGFQVMEYHMECSRCHKPQEQW